MSQKSESNGAQPAHRDKIRPFELVGFSAILAVFVAVVLIIVTRDIRLMAIFAGIAFIVALLIFSLLALSIKPSKEDEEARKNLKPGPNNSAH